MAHSMAHFLTDAEVEQLLESSPWMLVGTKGRGGKPALKGLISTRLSDLASQLRLYQLTGDLDKGQATAFDFS